MRKNKTTEELKEILEMIEEEFDKYNKRDKAVGKTNTI